MGQAAGDMGENVSGGAQERIADGDFPQGVQEEVQEIHEQVFPDSSR